MATHSSTVAWKIPWTEEPGRLQSMGSQSRIRLSDFTVTFTLMKISTKVSVGLNLGEFMGRIYLLFSISGNIVKGQNTSFIML